jgi:hypothetical protein
MGLHRGLWNGRTRCASYEKDKAEEQLGRVVVVVDRSWLVLEHDESKQPRKRLECCTRCIVFRKQRAEVAGVILR